MKKLLAIILLALPIGVMAGNFDGHLEELSGEPISRIDSLFDWMEENHPYDLPSHQESFYMEGYKSRHYPSTNVYISVRDNRVCYYIDTDKTMWDLGGLDDWLRSAGI